MMMGFTSCGGGGGGIGKRSFLVSVSLSLFC